jgi:hypothetical protein
MYNLQRIYFPSNHLIRYRTVYDCSCISTTHVCEIDLCSLGLRYIVNSLISSICQVADNTDYTVGIFYVSRLG